MHIYGLPVVSIYSPFRHKSTYFDTQDADTFRSEEDFSYPHGLGYCFVISFDSKREGSQADIDAVKKLCRELGMKEDVCQNEEKVQVLERLKKVIEIFNNQTNAFAFLSIFIMAHGGTDKQGKEYIATNEEEKLFLNSDILSKLSKANCPGLKGKATLAFVQACRGPNTNIAYTDADVNGNPEITPNVADMLVWKATVENTVAVRKEEGTWFVNAIVNKILSQPDKRLYKIITEVTSKAFKERIPLDTGGSTFPIPCISHSTLRADFYFKT